MGLRFSVSPFFPPPPVSLRPPAPRGKARRAEIRRIGSIRGKKPSPDALPSAGLPFWTRINGLLLFIPLLSGYSEIKVVNAVHSLRDLLAVDGFLGFRIRSETCFGGCANTRCMNRFPGSRLILRQRCSAKQNT